MQAPALNLNGLVDKPSFEALNAYDAHSFDEVIKSIDDEQLLIRAAFQTPVKISRISFRCATPQNGPKTVHIFTNRATPTFDEVDDWKPVATLELTVDQLKAAEQIILKYVCFQNVKSIIIYVQSNQDGSEQTQVDQIVIWGSEEQAMDMKKWEPKKEEDGA